MFSIFSFFLFFYFVFFLWICFFFFVRIARDNRREHPFPCGMAVVLKASSKPLRKDAAEYSGQHFVLALGPGRARRFLSP